MNCPHCNKVVLVHLTKDSTVGQVAPTQATTDDLGELLNLAEGNNIKGQSLDFVTETRKRYKQYGSSTRMSDKQMSWLRKLAYPETSEDEWS